MAGIATRIAWNHLNLTYACKEFKFPEQLDSSSSDMEFGFLEEGDENGSFDDSNSDESFGNEMVDLSDDEKDNDEITSVENENKKYWETQHQLLQATLRRTSSLESKIRNAVKEALNDIRRSETVCSCGKSVKESCRVCLTREVFDRLRNAGFNAAICSSKWRSSPDIPSGEHTFLDVIERSRKGEVRVIIELKFRGEFEIARASEDYNRLGGILPEVFVGKVERLNSVIKILCLAAKKCMKEKKMHMGPWRKQRYMQAKWLTNCQRNPMAVGYSVAVRVSRPRASMLTVDLLGSTLA